MNFLMCHDFKIKNKNNFEFTLTDKNSKNQKITLDFDPLLIDFFALTFTDFYNKAREMA